MSWDDYEISPLWRLSDSVTITQGALLLLGLEPQPSAEFVDSWEAHRRPKGYIAARNAIMGAISSGVVEGDYCFHHEENPMGGFGSVETRSIDYNASTVDVKSLSLWLASRGWNEGFFAAQTRRAGFRDPQHPRYSAKLAAVVEAWECYEEVANGQGTVKQQLKKWLRLNAARFSLTNEDGVPSENVIDELAKVANWAIGGGAPRQERQGGNNLDEDIPF